jgi:hypothetical protein
MKRQAKPGLIPGSGLSRYGAMNTAFRAFQKLLATER